MRFLKYLSILSLVLFFAGCATADKSAGNVLVSQSNKYIVNTIPLDKKVKIVGSRSKFHNNLLLAEVDIKNSEQKRYNLEYRFRWLDDSGFEVDKTPWLPLTLNAMELRSIQRVATNHTAESFKFYLRLKQ